MIAAVAAVVAGGAFAACNYGGGGDDDCGPYTWAYTWKFTGKTTEGAMSRTEKGKKANCNLGSDDKYEAIRVPASLKIQGYTAYCDVNCSDFEALAECQEVFWQTKPEKLSLAGGLTFEVANIIGKKGKQYEVMGLANFAGFVDEDADTPQDQVKYELTFAGLGKYDKKKNRLSSASGNFAGTLQYPWLVTRDVCIYAGIWECSCNGLTFLGDETPVDSVAFGKWNVKFNKKAARKLENNEARNIYHAAKVPNWVNYLNEDEGQCGK